MSVGHYENFPVGSVLLPKRLRKPIHAIYHFARTADDYADEGDVSDEERLANLDALRQELDLLATKKDSQNPMIAKLYQDAIKPFNLPLQPFYDLLSAFSQDVTVKRYETFGEIMDYSRRSANPVGTLLLHLYGVTDKKQFAMSDAICSALQFINFWQDIAIDWQKNRVYLPQEDLRKFGVTEDDIANKNCSPAFKQLVQYQCDRAHKMLLAGSPLATLLKGRIGFELRMIVLGGQRILHKIDQNQYDIFDKRPTLKTKDWYVIIKRAIMKK